MNSTKTFNPLKIAALYVDPYGPYSGLDHVDLWPEKRDARRYDGPNPVIAHPPCARWGRYWFGGPMAKIKLKLGDDGGCFQAALAAVRKYGGVLEHPEGSHAWKKYGLNRPSQHGGWIPADWIFGFAGWTCCVEQVHYGHRSRKKTWLYAMRTDLPNLKWGKSAAKVKLEDGFHSAEARRQAKKSPFYKPVERLSHRERALTPIPFRNLLIEMALSVHHEPY